MKEFENVLLHVCVWLILSILCFAIIFGIMYISPNFDRFVAEHRWFLSTICFAIGFTMVDVTKYVIRKYKEGGI